MESDDLKGEVSMGHTTFVTSKAGLGNLKRCMVFHEGTWSLKGVHGLSKGYYDNIMLYKSLYWCCSCNPITCTLLLNSIKTTYTRNN